MQRLQNGDPIAMYKTGIIITEPKSRASLRTISLPDFVVKAIKPFVGSPNAYISSGECKSVVEPRTMQNRFKGYLERGHIAFLLNTWLKHFQVGVCGAKYKLLWHKETPTRSTPIRVFLRSYRCI